MYKIKRITNKQQSQRTDIKTENLTIKSHQFPLEQKTDQWTKMGLITSKWTT